MDGFDETPAPAFSWEAPQSASRAPHSLADALAGVPEELGFPTAARLRVIVTGRRRPLRSSSRDDVYCIAREAITNAYRHAQAKDIQVEIEYRSGSIRLVVRDNGRGIDPHKLELGSTGRWGLQLMRERADQLGARLRVLSGIARGTEVELCLAGSVAFEPLRSGPGPRATK